VAGSGKNEKPAAKPKAKDPAPKVKGPAPNDAVQASEPPQEAILIEENQSEPGESVMSSDIDAEIQPSVAVADAPPSAPRRRGVFVAVLLGGLLAGAIGFAAAQYFGNDRWPFNKGVSATEELAAVVAEQNTRIDALQNDIARLSQTVSGLPERTVTDALSASQEEAAKTVASLANTISGLDQRIADLEMRPVADGSGNADAVAAYKKELEAMRAMFQQQLDRVQAVQEQASKVQLSAEEIARKAAIRDALGQIEAAAGSGLPFGDALAILSDAGATVPQALALRAGRGIVSFARLQAAFPDAARAALDAATRAEVQAGTTSKLTAFLRTRLGARSLQPRQGDDADAVLSRAQAALRNGDIGGALAELQALPPEGLAKMRSWMDLANSRIDAMAEIATLRANVNE
jgi:hypothetical protein